MTITVRVVTPLLSDAGLDRLLADFYEAVGSGMTMHIMAAWNEEKKKMSYSNLPPVKPVNNPVTPRDIDQDERN